MQLFYAPDILATNILPEDESYHCVKVLRMGRGEIINIIDGRGTLYEARLTIPDTRRAQVEIISEIQGFGNHPYNLHVAIAPTKNIDRFEWFVEKAVEIGIDTITPILCRFSERKVIRHERIEKIALSAAKQSLKARVPQIGQMTDFDKFVVNSCGQECFIAHCYDTPKDLFVNVCKPHKNTVVMIGPEGDFSKQEVEFALKNGYRAISLSMSRLRTETAGIVAVDTVAILNVK